MIPPKEKLVVPSYTMAQALEVWEKSCGQKTISTGIPCLDAALGGGLPVGQMTVLTGGPGAYKSDFCRQLRRRIIARGFGCIHVDVELTAGTILGRDLAQDARIPFNQLKKKPEDRTFTKEQLEHLREASERIKLQSGIIICPAQGTPLYAVQASIELAAKAFPEGRPYFLILDSGQRLADGIVHDQIRVQVQKFCRWAEGFCHTHQVAMIVTSEQHRTNDGKLPTPDEALTSGAESRALEYTSDVLIGLYRLGNPAKTEAADADCEKKRSVRALIAKNRNGSLGYLPLDFQWTQPYWDFHVVSRGTEKITREELSRCASLLEFGRNCSLTELATIWNVDKTQAKLILEQLQKSTIMERHGHGWVKISEEVSPDVVREEEIN